MANDKIVTVEVELLLTAIERITSSEVLEKDINSKLPLTTDLPDANKIYHGKVSVLFVDMRGSTKLPDKFSSDQLVKIYRSYIRTVVQAIRYSGGVVRDFMGDGVLAVFVDDIDGKSVDKSVRAARYITTAIDKFLNPILDEKIKHRISYGIGIHTGEISLSKVGMKGKEQDTDSENEFGIAWIGNSTNLACKFSSAVDRGTIFISASTYAELSDIESKQMWRKIEFSKGSNTLSGYIAEHYYLQLDQDVEPCVATDGDDTLRQGDEVGIGIQKQLSSIVEKALELGRKEQSLQDREEKLNIKVAEINRKEKENFEREKSLYKNEYDFYCDILGSGHCKAAYVKEMGQDFWEENLEDAIAAGAKLGKDEHKVKQEISYAMVSIYEDLEIYDKAYDFLVEQAAGHPWLHLSTVQKIVAKVQHCDRLKSAIYKRLAKNDLSADYRYELEKIKNWLAQYKP